MNKIVFSDLTCDDFFCCSEINYRVRISNIISSPFDLNENLHPDFSPTDFKNAEVPYTPSLTQIPVAVGGNEITIPTNDIKVLKFYVYA